MHTNPITRLSIAGLFAMSGAAFAQAPQAEALRAEETREESRNEKRERVTALSPVQVTARRQAQRLAEVPQPVTVVDREQIQRSTPQIWTDALRGQPGVFNQSSGPGQGIIIVRGLKGSEVLHLVDGMRLNNAFFRNAPTQYIALVDPYNIERIELLRGPASVLYGSDALGGVVQLFTPEQRFDAPQWSARGRALAQFGSSDLSTIGRSEFAAGREGLSLSGGFTYMDFGQQINADGERLRGTDYLARAFDAKTIWAPATGHELMFAASRFEVPQLARYHQIVAGFGAQPDSDFNFFQPNTRSFYHGRYRWQLGRSFADTAAFHAARQVIRDDRYSQDFQGSRTQTDRNRSTLDGITAQFDKTLGTHALIYGLEFYRDAVQSARFRTSLSSGQTSQSTSSFPDGAVSQTVGVYLNDGWTLSDRWLLDAGLRYTRARTELPPADRGVGSTVDDSDVTGNLGARYRISPALNWTANLGRGFRAPNVFDLGTLGERPSNRFNIPNPDLHPETVTSVDTGLKWFDGDLAAEAVIYYSRYRDRISSVETGNPRSDGRTEVQSRNLARAEYYGAEAGLRWQAAPGVTAYGTLNYTRGEEEMQGQASPANRVPPLNGRLGVLTRPLPTVEVESFILFADRQDRLAPLDVDDSRINPNGTGGWARLDLRLAWTPTPMWRLQLSGSNLLDADYREHGSGITAPGRGLALTAEARFH